MLPLLLNRGVGRLRGSGSRVNNLIQLLHRLLRNAIRVRC